MRRLCNVFCRDLILKIARADEVSRATMVFNGDNRVVVSSEFITITSYSNDLRVIKSSDHEGAFGVLGNVLTYLCRIFLTLQPCNFTMNVVTRQGSNGGCLNFLHLTHRFVGGFGSIANGIGVRLLYNVILCVASGLGIGPMFTSGPFRKERLVTIQVFNVMLLRRFSSARAFT